MPKCVGEGLIMELELKFMVEKVLNRGCGRWDTRPENSAASWIPTILSMKRLAVSVPGCAFAKIRSTKALR